MDNIIKGKVIVLGDNIDTDQIYPGRYLELINPEDLAKHCLEGVDPSIAENFKKGSIIVAGKNFGCGSSREHAVIALQSMGAGIIIADSFARIFFRNAINLGLPLLICKGIGGEVENFDILEARLDDGYVLVPGKGKKLKAEQISPNARQILDAGGIKNIFRKKYLGVTGP